MVVAALLGFVGTVTVARFIERRAAELSRHPADGYFPNAARVTGSQSRQVLTHDFWNTNPDRLSANTSKWSLENVTAGTPTT